MIDQRAKPFILVTIEEGLVSGVSCYGIDLSEVNLIKIDYDTDGADDDELSEVGGVDCFFTVGGVEVADDDTVRDVSRAYLDWSLT